MLREQTEVAKFRPEDKVNPCGRRTIKLKFKFFI
jgi:hypothetical protein